MTPFVVILLVIGAVILASFGLKFAIGRLSERAVFRRHGLDARRLTPDFRVSELSLKRLRDPTTYGLVMTQDGFVLLTLSRSGKPTRWALAFGLTAYFSYSHLKGIDIVGAPPIGSQPTKRVVLHLAREDGDTTSISFLAHDASEIREEFRRRLQIGSGLD
jgi:hypothetical protein